MQLINYFSGCFLQRRDLTTPSLLLIAIDLNQMISKRNRIVFIMAGLLVVMLSPAQDVDKNEDVSAKSMYLETIEKFGKDPLLRNGPFYEYPYHRSEGNPFLMDLQFRRGTLVYRNRVYDQIPLRYDVFHQQIIINQQQKEESVQILLHEAYLSEFSLAGMHFKKVSLENDEPTYCQIVANDGDLSCLYYWYKSRRESHDNGNYKIYVFSEPEKRAYLNIHGEFHKYRNNRTFTRAFPREARKEVRSYLRTRDIKVKKADDKIMQQVISFCSTIMNSPNNQ